MISKKRILVTGSSGMLGSQIVKTMERVETLDLFTLSRHGSDYHQHYECDIAEGKRLIDVLEIIQPEIIIHCAALTNISYCESNKDYAHKVHVQSTEYLSSFNSVRKFVYISTDSVFDGQTGYYSEDSDTNPLNYYALTKLKGEEAAFHNDQINSIVLRTNIIGFCQPPGNSLFEWAVQSLKDNESITGFSNVYFNPLYCGDLAKIILEIIMKEFDSGVYNVGANGAISKFEFIDYVKSTMHLDGTVLPGILENDPQNVTRPLNTVLLTSRIEDSQIVLPTIKGTIDNLIKSYLEINQMQ